MKAIRLVRLAARSLTLLLAGASVSVKVFSADAELSLSSGLLYATNMTRGDLEESPETAATVGISGALKREGTWSSMSVVGDLTYLTYLGNTFEDQLAGRADARLDLLLASDRLKWITEANFGQLPIDPSIPVTPENQEDIRFFSTGPEILMPLGSSGFLVAAARASSVNYEVSEQSGSRASASVELGRGINERNKLSVSASADSLKFDQSASFPDYTRKNLYASYQGRASRTQFAIAAGGTQVDGAAQSQRNPLLIVSLERQLTRATAISVFVGRRLTDMTDSFRRVSPVGAPPSVPDVTSGASPATFRRNDAEIEWSTIFARTSFSLRGTWVDDKFAQNSNFDLQILSFEAFASRELSPLLSGSLRATKNSSTYRNFPLKNRSLLASASLDFRITKRLSLVGTVAYETSSGGVRFRDERVGLAVRYTPTNAVPGRRFERDARDIESQTE